MARTVPIYWLDISTLHMHERRQLRARAFKVALVRAESVEVAKRIEAGHVFRPVRARKTIVSPRWKLKRTGLWFSIV